MRTLRKRRYSVDLAGLQAVCDMNYARLQRLMPGWHERDRWQVVLQHGDQPAQTLLIQCNERRHRARTQTLWMLLGMVCAGHALGAFTDMEAAEYERQIGQLLAIAGGDQ